MTKCISIGIVNYNGGEHLRNCVMSALSQERQPVTVLVYDNASTDGSMQRIADLNRVLCLKGAENRGYAFACNRLIEAMETEIVVVANMDLEFDRSWAGQVSAAFDAHPEADGVASLVLEQGDPVTVNFAGMGFFPDLHAQSLYAGTAPEKALMEPSLIFGAYGAVMAFRKSLFGAIGFFDEDYFLFYEETEFFWRMNLFGRKTIFWPKAKVLHYRSLTTKRFSPLKLYYTERNRLYTGLKILPVRRYPSLFLWSLYRLLLMRSNTDAAVKEKMRERGASTGRVIVTIAAAWLDALRALPVILKKRRQLWRRSGATSKVTVEILNRYYVPWKALSLK